MSLLIQYNSYFILVETNIETCNLFEWYLHWTTNQNVQQWGLTTNVNRLNVGLPLICLLSSVF